MANVPGLKSSFAYRRRLLITLLALIAGWIAGLFTVPHILEHTDLDHLLDLAAWLVLLAGIGIRAWASREISGRKKSIVVASGPYALCRNPLYWGTFFIAVSQLLFLRTVVFAILILIPSAVYVFGVVPAEERYLSETLGLDYQAYCQSTPRWWPHWNSRVFETSGPLNARQFYRELTTLICWLSLPLMAETICYLRELPNWPHWWVLI